MKLTQIRERVDIGQPKTGLLYRWVEPKKAVSNMNTNSLNPGKWKHNIPGVGSLAGISFGYNAKEWYDHNSSSEAICFVVDRAKLNPKKIIDIPGNEVFQYTIHTQNQQTPDMIRANKAIENDINDPSTEPDEAFYAGIIKPLNTVLVKIIIPASVGQNTRRHAWTYAQKFNIPVSEPYRVKITESTPRTLYHGTTVDVANRYRVQRWGLEPRVGDFVRDAYGLNDMEDVDDAYRPLTFAADKPELGKALNAIVHHVAKKLGKRSITPQEFLNHGALIVLKHAGDDFQHMDRDEYDTEGAIEPGDYYTDYRTKGDFFLTGSKLKRVLERLGLWPYEHGMIDWPDEVYDQGFPSPRKGGHTRFRKAAPQAVKQHPLFVPFKKKVAETEGARVATKFWFHPRTKQFEHWYVRFSNNDAGEPHHDQALMANPQKFGLVQNGDKDGNEYSVDASEAGWVRGVIGSQGGLYLDSNNKKDAQLTLRYLIGKKLIDRRALDTLTVDTDVGSIRMTTRGEITEFLSEGYRPGKFEQFLAAVEKIAPYEEFDEEHGGHVSPAPRGYINFRESPYRGAVEIANIGAIDRGGGKNILGMVCKLADAMKVKLSVHASPVATPYRHEGDSESLFLFYEYFGFDSDRKRDEEWDFKGKHMIRLPNSNPDHAAIKADKQGMYDHLNAQLQQWRNENLGESDIDRHDPRNAKNYWINKGTILYHGTSSDDWSETTDDIIGPFWVRDGRKVAQYFKTWQQYKNPNPRIITFRTTRRLRMMLMTQEIWDYIEAMYDEATDIKAVAEIICGMGFDGWVTPDNYPDGSDIMICQPNGALQHVETVQEQLNEVHYQDMFPPRFESFHKKYRTKVRRKEINPDHYWVQFRNFAEDKLDRTAFENPTHTDPMGVYAYPLRYVLQHPADIWYGAAARYLRVIRNTAKNPLDLKELNDLGWGRIENLLWRMGLNLNKSDLRWIKRQYRWTGKYAPVMTFMRAMQIKHNDEPTEDGWGQKKWPMRSAKEQTQLLLKAGYDAVIDQGTGAINEREPEQAIFLTRASFRVEETFDLRHGKGETDHMTINQPGSNREFIRKFGQMIATALDDKLTDKRETSNLMGWTYMWTKKGRRIEIQIERPDHYYKTRGPLEKPHKYDRKHTNHVIDVNIRTEFGDIEVAERYGRAKLDEIVQDIAHRYRRLQVEQKPTSWTPQDRAEFHAQQERERYEMVGNRMRAEQDMPPIRYDEMMKLKDQGLNVFGVPLAKARMLHWKELWQRHNANPANPKMKLKQFIDQQEAELAAAKTMTEGANGDLPQQYSFHNDVTGHHHGQTDGTLYFYDRATAGDDWPPRRVVGKLDWTKYQGKVFINYIRVTPEFQRRGIGKALVNELKKEFPEEEVVWTNTTPDGTALRKSMS